MSIATQVKRLQNVRNQIRTKMVALGLSKNTDLLQDLADDLDGVDKISPTNNGTTDPGTGYTNVDTLSRSTSTRYIKVPKGYNDANRKFTVSGVANGAYSASVSSHTTSNAAASSSVTGSVTDVTTTTKPSGTDGTDYYTITPKLTTTAGLSKATGKATIDAAGYLDAGNKSSSESSKSVEVTASQGSNYYLKAGAYSASVSSHTTTNATASSSVNGSITSISSTAKPTTGTDGVDYYTITPGLVTGNGGSKAAGKATVGTAGYLSTGDTTSAESSKTVGVTASQGDDYYLPSSVVTKEDPGVDPGTGYLNRATVDSSTEDQYVKITRGYLPDSKITFKKMPEGSISSATIDDPGADYANRTTVTPAKKRQYVKIGKGYLPNGKITVEAISSSSFDTSGVTATADTVLKDYKFVDSNGITVTGTIATATSNDVSGNVSGSNPDKILLTTGKTSGSSSTTATAEATVAKKLYTGSSNIVKSLTSKTLTATAEATLATATTSSITVPSTLPTGTVTITPSADNTKRIYSDTKNNGFITNVVLNPMPAGAYSASVSSHTTTNATASSKVSGSIVNITSATKPSTGNDGADYFTITPKLTTAAGSSKATGKATVDTAGYLATGNTTSEESSKSVGVTATQGDNYYLPAGSYSASVSSHTTSNATASSSVTGSITGVATTTKPAGTDGTNYYTITPKLTTGAGSSKATGKATIDTSGYLATGSATSSESSKAVSVTATQGDNYYLKAGSYSASVASHTTSNATASSSVTGSITNIVTSTKPSTGTDGTDYYTITPKLTTAAGSSKATGKATVDTAGYLATGNTTSSESSVDVGVTASQGDSCYLKASSVTKEDPGTSYANKATVTPSTSAQYVKVTAGYLPNSKITVEAIPSPYFNTSKVTATAGTVLKDYKFVDSSGATVTGTIATASSGDVSGSVSGSDPKKITLTTEETLKSSTTTATAEATVTKGLYTGSSNIVADLTSKDFTATAEAKLATSVSGSTPVPSTLPAGTVTITPNTDNTKRIYSDSTNKGFITNVVLKPMSTSSVTIPDPNKDPGTDYTNQVTVTPSGTSAKYVKITAGHLPNSKITIEKMAGGSVADATTTKPDTSSTSYPNQTTVTPTKTTQYVKITAGYLPNSKITIDAIPSTTLTVAKNAWTKLTSATELGSYSQTVTGVTGVLTDNDVVVVPGDSSVVALYGVYASSQGASSITFKAFDKPTSDMSYKVYILNK